ncbi:MAG TPA: RIP metalloprotease RseP [Gammaproteobacteria bacterium]|nr:RIP metalloprotease RseP [Gammaproteobacteria bacterium]
MEISFFEYVLWFIVAISVLVAAHEFGHYYVARRLGFKVLRFSIGFGRPLLRWRGGPPDHVEYWLSALPIGGYVKMLDEHEGPVDPNDRARAFHQRPIWQRVAVLLAGPAFNFLFAILAYWAMFVSGVQAVKPVIAAVETDSVAARAGIAPGDAIEAIGGEPVATWEDATLRFLDELLGDGRIDLALRSPDGVARDVELDVRGRSAEITEPTVLWSGLGIRLGLPPVVGKVVEGSPAEQAGLRAGDRMLRVDGEPVATWNEWAQYLRARPGATVEIALLRGDREIVTRATLKALVDRTGQSYNGVGVEQVDVFTVQRYGFIESLPRAVTETWKFSVFSVSMVAHMITGEVSLKNMSGPLSIGEIAGSSANAGFAMFLKFLAAVSISLGIINLFPIPLLDGGQIVYQLAEGIKGSPLSERVMLIGHQLGILFIIALMGFAFYNDVVRMFGS